MARLISVLALLFVVVVYVSAKTERADNVPKEIREAEKTLSHRRVARRPASVASGARGNSSAPQSSGRMFLRDSEESWSTFCLLQSC